MLCRCHMRIDFCHGNGTMAQHFLNKADIDIRLQKACGKRMAKHASGKLNAYLAKIDRQAQEHFERLIGAMKQAQGITEQPKAENAVEWSERLNNIRNCAIEIINKEIIYT